MTSPNSSQTHCFASVTADAAVLRAYQYLATASGVSWDNTSRKASFFSRTTSLTTGVQQGVWGFAAPWGTYDFETTAPCRSFGNRSFEHHPLANLHRDARKPHQRCELKVSQTGTSSNHSQFTTRLGLPGLSRSFPFHLTQLTTRWWSVDSSAPVVSKGRRHTASDQMIRSQNRSSTFCLGWVSLCLNMVFVMANPWLTLNSHNKPPLPPSTSHLGQQWRRIESNPYPEVRFQSLGYV